MMSTLRGAVCATLALTCAWSVCACDESGAQSAMPAMSEVDLDTATGDGVSGTIDSEDFEALDVRYRVIDRVGRERVDFLFSDTDLEQCGLPIKRDARLVWLRVPGLTDLSPATYSTDADGEQEHSLSVHYEQPEGRGYETVGRGSARLEVVALENERLEGRVAVCFADASSSCVRGSFEAYPCYSRIQGRALREAPGLADEALEPPERRP